MTEHHQYKNTNIHDTGNNTRPVFSLPDTAHAFFKLRHFVLYEDQHRTKLFLVGCDASKRQYRVMRIAKKNVASDGTIVKTQNGGGGDTVESNGNDDDSLHHLEVHVDPSIYSVKQMNNLLAMLSEASKRRVVENKKNKKSWKKNWKRSSKKKEKRDKGKDEARVDNTSNQSDVVDLTGDSKDDDVDDDEDDDEGDGYKYIHLTATSTNTRGGLRVVLKAYGVAGFIKLTRGYYAVMITKCEKAGEIGPHTVYEISDTELVPLFNSRSHIGLFKSDEQKYRELFQTTDLTKDFYFSYTYDLSQTLQHNMSHDHVALRPRTEFIWNKFLLDPLSSCSHNSDAVQLQSWVVPLIHGYYGQKCISILNQKINLVLIARRSRFYAGTRYLKRGLDDQGHVANHVETEQIVFESNSLLNQKRQGRFSAIAQMRGSIPLHWSQTIVTKVVNPKPEPLFTKFDPMFTASKRHFDYVLREYGSPSICLDLIKQHEKKPRERPLGRVFHQCVEFLNDTAYSKDDEDDHMSRKLIYLPYDFKHATKNNPEMLLNEMSTISEQALEQTSFFCSYSYTAPERYSLQSGVLRTNCIDCLDRTNVAQFFVGKQALAQQLHAIGITDSPFLIHGDQIIRELMTLYEILGDKIALQYGGSATVSAGINHRGHGWDIVTSAKRYYSNNFKDNYKQGAMNLFLGSYRTGSNLPKLWEMETDLYLHGKHSNQRVGLQVTPQSIMYDQGRKKMFREEFYKPFEMEDMNTLLAVSDTDMTQVDSTANKQSRSELKSSKSNPDSDSAFEYQQQRLQRSLSIATEDGAGEYFSDSPQNSPQLTSEESFLSMDIDQDLSQSFSLQGTRGFRFPGLTFSSSHSSRWQDAPKFKTHAEVLQSMEGISSNADTTSLQHCIQENHNLLSRNTAADESIHIKTSDEEMQIYADYINKFESGLDRKPKSLSYKKDKFSKNVTTNASQILEPPEQFGFLCEDSVKQKDFYFAFLDNCLTDSQCGTFRIKNADMQAYQKSSRINDTKKSRPQHGQSPAVDEDIAMKHREYARRLRSIMPSRLVHAAQTAVDHQNHPHYYQMHRGQYEPIGPQFDEMRQFFPGVRTNRMLLDRIKDIVSRMKTELRIEDRIRYLAQTKRRFNKQSLYSLLKASVYKKCFVGSEAVNWIVENNIIANEREEENSDDEIMVPSNGLQKKVSLPEDDGMMLKRKQRAVAFLTALLKFNVFQDVRFDDKYHDNYLLYRFYEDDKIRVLNLMLKDEWETSSHVQEVESEIPTDAMLLSFDLVIKATKLFTYYRKLSSNYHTGGRYTSRNASNSASKKNKISLMALKQMTPRDVVNMTNNSLFQVFVREAMKLRNLDLTLLGRKEKMCFFINIYNLLFLHGLMIRGGFSGQRELKETEEMVFFRRSAYQISGHLFSLRDIRDGILRGNELSPRCFSRPFENEDDPRLLIAFHHNIDRDQPEEEKNATNHSHDGGDIISSMGYLRRLNFDPRVHFILSSFRSINLFFVHPDSLDMIMERESLAFLEKNVLINLKNRTVRLPKLFETFAFDFVRDFPRPQISSSPLWVSLLRRVQMFLPRTHVMHADIAHLLQHQRDGPIHVSYLNEQI